ncbi:MAG: hypothetical protein WCR19_02405 [Acholeplasmataceae bacterium]
MIFIKEVKSKIDAWRFTEFPNRLYKNVDMFVPALSMDERNVFNKKTNPVHAYCESIRFLAYRDGKIVGRIAGIINHSWNEAFKRKTGRFTRIDMIDDIEVTKTLIQAVTDWVKAKGMNQLIGPIGFTDLDREGMLVDGFDQLNMFITIYNHPYYHEHLEKLGFVKDVDWIEKLITWPTEVPDKIARGATIARERYGYKLIKVTKKKDIYKYIYEAFDVYNQAFMELYGFYPITNKVMDYYIKQVIALIQLDWLWFVADKDNKITGFAALMPSLAKVNKKNNGKVLPFGIFRILRSLKKHHELMDFYFVAIDPRHQNRGMMALFMEDAVKMGQKHHVKLAETGPELELNFNIQNQWKDFEFVNHKRRRCYIKEI